MSRLRRRTRRAHHLTRAALVLVLFLLAPAPALAIPVEDYAPYQPQKRCNPTAKPGTLELARWLQRTYPGTGSLGISRACGHGGVSEHKEGRAFDWKVDATSARDRGYVRDFLRRVLAADKRGNDAALARRMGIMYILWNDHSWASYRGFERRDYRHSSCRTLRRCSATLRHRDHVHISLSRAGARGDTSWYRRDQADPRPAPGGSGTSDAPDRTDRPAVLDLSRRPYARVGVLADGEPAVARFTLAGGRTYKLTAAGLVTYGRPDQVADASCVWAGDGWSRTPSARARARHGSLNLHVNGAPLFDTDCRSRQHRYVARLTPQRDTTLRLRLVNTGPAPAVPAGRLLVVVSRPGTDVDAALPDRPTLAPEPEAADAPRRGYGLLAETVAVPADSRRVSTAHELRKGVRYRVTVSGVAGLGRGVRTDGRCLAVDGTWFGRASLDRRRPGDDHGALYLDGVPFRGRSTGDGCSAHEYVAGYTPTRTGRVRLALWDPLTRSDNDGALTVRFERLTSVGEPTAAPRRAPGKGAAWTRDREWLSVPADRRGGVVTTLMVRKGEPVQVVARGSVRSGATRADAACVRTSEAWLRRDPGLALTQDPLELWVDGTRPRWRALGPASPCSAEHGYTARHVATKSGPLRLALFDLDHRDNSGELSVTVLRQR